MPRPQLKGGPPPTRTKIPADTLKQILIWAGQGLSQDDIVSKVRNELGVKAGRNAIVRRIRRALVERADIAKSVVSAELKGTLTADLDAMDWLAARARDLGLKAEQRQRIGLALQAVETELKVREARVRLAMNDKGKNNNFGIDARRNLVDRVNALVKHAEKHQLDLVELPKVH